MKLSRKIKQNLCAAMCGRATCDNNTLEDFHGKFLQRLTGNGTTAVITENNTRVLQEITLTS